MCISHEYNMKIIAHVGTCYGEKFGVPRQAGLVAKAWGELVFEPDFRNTDALRGLDGFSHVWLVFVFHQAIRDAWKPTVRPPRLGGNDKVGVFASRSPFRPNPIGLSCVKLEQIDYSCEENPTLKLSGVDLVDDTPVLDIKPYIPYADCLSDAKHGFAQGAPRLSKITWADDASAELTESTRQLITETLACDPRPAYQQDDPEREYGCLIDGYNVRWLANERGIKILSCSLVRKT